MEALVKIITVIGAVIGFVLNVCALALIIKGVIKVFSWTKRELSDLPAIFSNFIAGVVSLFLLPISLLVGIISIIPFLLKLWVKYVTERRRLTLAYIVIPITQIVIFLLFKVVVSLITNKNDNIMSLADVYLSLMLVEMLFVYIPPTVIRFVYKPQGFSYITEIFLYMLLSFLATASICYLLYSSIYFPSGSHISAVYLILSYKSERKESYSKWTSNSIWILLGFLSSFGNGIRQQQEQSLLVTFAISVIVTVLFSPLTIYCLSTLRKIKSSPQELKDSDNNTNTREVSGMADYLVDVGLAHIGRRTKTANPCITPEQTEERQRIERPFLKILSDNYEDAATRKMLSQYFMLYKEMLLFVIYAMVLRKNPVLHTEVKGKLIERLTEGVPPESVKLRNQYWRELSRQFYESDKGTQDIGHVLEEVFWGKLPKKIPPIPKCGRDSLRAIFDYTHEAIVQGLH